jgi:hypothetical protein
MQECWVVYNSSGDESPSSLGIEGVYLSKKAAVNKLRQMLSARWKMNTRQMSDEKVLSKIYDGDVDRYYHLQSYPLQKGDK